MAGEGVGTVVPKAGSGGPLNTNVVRYPEGREGPLLKVSSFPFQKELGLFIALSHYPHSSTKQHLSRKQGWASRTAQR